MGRQDMMREYFKSFIEIDNIPPSLREFIRCYDAVGDIFEEVWRPNFNKQLMCLQLKGRSVRQAMIEACEICNELISDVAVRTGFMTMKERSKSYFSTGLFCSSSFSSSCSSLPSF